MVRIEFNREQKRAIAFDEDTLVGECTFEENDNVSPLWNVVTTGTLLCKTAVIPLNP